MEFLAPKIKSESKKKSDTFFNRRRNAKSFFFQPKLIVGPVDDPYEREADTVAEKVMRMSDRDEEPLQPKISPLNVQLKCAECEEEERQLQKKDNGNGSYDREVPSLVNNVINSSGKSLDPGTKSFMESRFDYDFSGIKIHTDEIAAKSARSINALAYTSGNNIVFNEDQYSPGSQKGRQLLAHELTHVLQQGHAAQSKVIQRAAFVCDEYQTSYRSSYNPGPGIAITLSGNAFVINANMEVYGPGATAAIASQMQSTISRVWNASFSNGYSVTSNISITARGATADSSRTGIYVLNAEGMTRVMPSYWVVGSNEVRYFVGSPDTDINWTPAHEFGHLIGLPDHYSESILSRVGGLFGGTRTTTVDTGWEGNIMGSHGGVLESKNLEELKNLRFAKYTCVSGHLESPL
ncbi:MAG TPA: DUF4157 domain-containing protein [Cyclobacteriaceae bacterium]|nr:DUF4157 domain-containing protein [Cyclobacteriaceae bacterium]